MNMYARLYCLLLPKIWRRPVIVNAVSRAYCRRRRSAGEMKMGLGRTVKVVTAGWWCATDIGGGDGYVNAD